MQRSPLKWKERPGACALILGMGLAVTRVSGQTGGRSAPVRDVAFQEAAADPPR